jgi:hypothetical protein
MVSPPSKEDLKNIMKTARSAAKKAGLTKAILKDEIKLSRQTRKKERR